MLSHQAAVWYRPVRTTSRRVRDDDSATGLGDVNGCDSLPASARKVRIR